MNKIQALDDRKIVIDGREIVVRIGQYCLGGRPFVELICTADGTYYANLTYNDPNVDLADDEILIKNWSENVDVAKQMMATGWFEDTGRRARAGFCTGQVWKVL